MFTTNIGERIVVDHEHAIRIDIDANTRQPRPYGHRREGLDALSSRGAFYDLINLAHETLRDGTGYLCITSMGEEFELGNIDD